METNLPLHTFEKLRGYCPNIYTVLCSQLGVSYAHSFKSSFISVAEIFPLFMILDRRESNCQKLVASLGVDQIDFGDNAFDSKLPRDCFGFIRFEMHGLFCI